MLIRGKQGRSGSDRVRLVPPVDKSSRASLFFSIFFVLGSCAIGVGFWLTYDQSVPTVVAAEEISPGEVIERESLKIVENRDNFDRVTSFDEAVGQIAAIPITPGEPILPSHLGKTVTVAPDKTVIGVLLKPGGYPTRNIGAGSRVDVFAASSASADARLVASNVEVFDVTVSDSGSSDEILFALVLSQSEATEVTNASKQSSGVRIALRGSP